MFYGGILIFITLQIGLWCFLRSYGIARRFWLGFEVSGVASVLAMIACEVIPALTRLLAKNRKRCLVESKQAVEESSLRSDIGRCWQAVCIR
jgi:hypothetical protein